MSATIRFDDLEDAAEWTEEAFARRHAQPQPDLHPITAALSLGTGKSVPTLARFPCAACRGTGQFRSFSGRLVGACFRCRGTGLQKTDPAKAAARRVAKQLRQTEARVAAITAFHAAHPEVAAWLNAKKDSFSFAASLFEALGKWGSLTDGQLAAAQRCIARDAERTAERATRKPDAEIGGAGFTRLVTAFTRAQDSGLRFPKFRVQGYTFSLAGAASRNAGCLYVKRGELYCGRVDPSGAFYASRDATPEDVATLALIGRDPLGAAVMHGKQTGHCSCCGRLLENAESVALGIGPVCREKWGL